MYNNMIRLGYSQSISLKSFCTQIGYYQTVAKVTHKANWPIEGCVVRAKGPPRHGIQASGASFEEEGHALGSSQGLHKVVQQVVIFAL